MSARTVAVPLSAPASQVQFQLDPNVKMRVESVFVTIDNSGGGAIKPLLTVSDQNKQEVAAKRQGTAIPAGDTGSATWALRLDDEHVDGVTAVTSGDPELWTFPPAGPSVAIGRFTLAAQIQRDGAALAATVASGAVVVTTTNMRHNRVIFQHGVTPDIVSTPSRLIIVSAGLYLLHASASWTNFGAGDFGLCNGMNLAASPLVNPGIISRRIPNQTMTHESSLIIPLAAGTIVTQALGQNSGAPIAMPIGTLTAYRLGPLP